ncbi:MAG: hypothetical protein LBH00_07210 [Planctomycetaceae bacterium]|jgi:hypothetical protein|nr:hypothetical protein [Planctomycetaceae bacterium]
MTFMKYGLSFSLLLFISVFCFSVFAQSKPVKEPNLLPGMLPRQSRSGGTIYRVLFDKLSDAEDSDGWPDRWTRKEGFDGNIPFPVHLAIGNAEYPSPFGNYALRMNMEGGAAAVFSPKIPIRPGMSYTVSAYAATDKLVFDDVSILAAFYGDEAKPIRTIESKKIRNTNGWQQLVIGPVPADMPKVNAVSVGLLVMPGHRQDYGAKVHFTNVEIRESPTVFLEMANADHLFFTARNLNVRCQFRGLDPKQHSVLFILEDPFGRVIGQKEVEMMIGNYPASTFFVTKKNNIPDVIHGTAAWKNLPIRSNGFYRIRVAAPPSYVQQIKLPPDQPFDDPLNDADPLTFAVMPTGSFLPGGEFGWNLGNWSSGEMIRKQTLLTQSGLSHLKLPVWLSSETDPKERDALINFCNNLSQQQVHLVGLLKPVPKALTEKIPFGQSNAASVISSNPPLWGQSLQPALQSFSLLVKDWQWAADSDQSLNTLFFDPVGKKTPEGIRRFQSFQKLFDPHQFGFGIGLTWDWNQDLPESDFPFPNLFLNFPADNLLTPEDTAQYLADTALSPFRRCISVAPLSADHYDLETRIADFVRRLVLMKISGVDSVYLDSPKDEQTGVLRQDGTPGEMYLPWRTTAVQLSGSRLLGSITLPNRSRNYCFDKGGGKCVMVIWNELATPEKPVRETLYLGKEPEMTDVWGKQTVPEQAGLEQTIPVSPVPVFITGLNINAVKFRLSMQTGVKQITAVPNLVHTIPLSFKNESANPFSVQIMPEGPREGDWQIQPPQTVNLETGLAGSGQFDLTLTPRGDTGLRKFRYSVKISGVEPAEFAVYDEMMIGNPDVYMEFVTRLNEKNEMEVIQTFVNNSDQIYSYDCRLFIPDRPLQKMRITRKGFGRSEYVYTIKKGRELIAAGKELMLRAIPIDDGSGSTGEPMVYTIPAAAD